MTTRRKTSDQKDAATAAAAVSGEVVLARSALDEDHLATLMRDEEGRLRVAAVLRASGEERFTVDVDVGSGMPVTDSIAAAISNLRRRITHAAPKRIVRLIKIVDTREREERDGMYSSYNVPVPGTGIEHPCDRCGEMHEVHAYVELEDGSTANVGTNCAKRAAMDAGDAALARQIANADRRAKIRATLLAQIRDLRRLVAERATNEKRVDAVPVPSVETRPVSDDGRRWEIVCGDAHVFGIVPLGARQDYESEHDVVRRHREARKDLQEREESARRAWREKRHAELGTGTFDHREAPRHLQDALEKLAKFDAIDATR